MGAGVDWAFVPELPSSVVITRAPGVFGAWMSEYVLGWCLWVTQRMETYRAAQREQRWLGELLPARLRGATLALVGVGDIGRVDRAARRDWRRNEGDRRESVGSRGAVGGPRLPRRPAPPGARRRRLRGAGSPAHAGDARPDRRAGAGRDARLGLAPEHRPRRPRGRGGAGGRAAHATHRRGRARRLSEGAAARRASAVAARTTR